MPVFGLLHAYESIFVCVLFFKFVLMLEGSENTNMPRYHSFILLDQWICGTVRRLQRGCEEKSVLTVAYVVDVEEAQAPVRANPELSPGASPGGMQWFASHNPVRLSPPPSNPGFCDKGP